MLYGVISKTNSLNSPLQVFTIPGTKAYLLGLSINSPPAARCPDANCKRPNEVFGYIYYLLLAHYQKEISEGYLKFTY